MSIRERVISWSNNEPLWRQDLLRRVATSEASDTDCAEVLELLLKERGLTSVAPAARPLQLEDLPEESPRSPEIVVEIGRCSNVNSIESEDPLTFERSGITLVYGDNAAGKSGYARALKSIARAAHREVVLPNVFASNPAKEPQAVVEVETDGVQSPHIVTFSSAQIVLPSTTVFDGRCASAYLGSRRKIEFTPIPLLVFGRAATAQQKLSALVEARIAALRQNRPNLESFPEGTKVRRTLESFEPPPTAEKVREMAPVTDAERDKLAQLKLEVASSEAGAVPTTIHRLTTSGTLIQQIASKVDAVASALSPENEKELKAARQRVDTARRSVELARNRAFADEPLHESGSDEWTLMWSAARAFVVDGCGHTFPPVAEDDVCPLCQQPLGAEARDRLQRFEDFVLGTVEEELRAAELALSEVIARLAPQELTSIADSVIDSLEVESPDIAQVVRGWLNQARVRSSALIDGTEAVELPEPPSARLRAKATEQLDAADRLQAAAADPTQVTARQLEIAELTARIALEQRLDEILAWCRDATAFEKLKQIQTSDLATTQISLAFGNLAREVVTQELRDAIKRELSELRFAHLKVDLDYRTERGEATAQIGLDGASHNRPLDEILSESEQRSCALAFFLAEALMSDSEGTVIFDDPASSLDAERLAQITRRIVELAKKRKQVIVFTHHAAFGWNLQEVAKQENVKFAPRLIATLGGRTGIVRNSRAWPGEGIKGRIGMLRNDLQRIEALERSGNIDAYEREARSFAADVRVAWEHAVEEQLFGGVVMRFQRDVKTLNIRQITVTPSLTKEVFDGMTETNPFHHAETMEAPAQTPTVAELRGFFSRLEAFAALVKAAQDGTAIPGQGAPSVAAADHAPGAA